MSAVLFASADVSAAAVVNCTTSDYSGECAQIALIIQMIVIFAVNGGVNETKDGDDEEDHMVDAVVVVDEDVDVVDDINS